MLHEDESRAKPTPKGSASQRKPASSRSSSLPPLRTVTKRVTGDLWSLRIEKRCCECQNRRKSRAEIAHPADRTALILASCVGAVRIKAKGQKGSCREMALLLG